MRRMVIAPVVSKLAPKWLFLVTQETLYLTEVPVSCGLLQVLDNVAAFRLTSGHYGEP
jgi:hypothetical protein